MISLIPHLLSEEKSFEKSHMADFSNDALIRYLNIQCLQTKNNSQIHLTIFLTKILMHAHKK